MSEAQHERDTAKLEQKCVQNLAGTSDRDDDEMPHELEGPALQATGGSHARQLPPHGSTNTSPSPAPAAPNLERASNLSHASATLSAEMSDDAEETVRIAEPEDDAPLRRFVTRTSSFTREDFDELLRHTGLFNVAGPDLRLERSHLPPNKLDPPPRRHNRRERWKRRHKSIMGLPMVRPDSPGYTLWSVLVLLSDLTYSAFIVPISIGMWTSFFAANWTTVSDFLFGAIFFVDLFMGFHVGFIASYNSRKLLVMNGRLVAKHYLYSFMFVVDAFATLAWIMQIVLVTVYHSVTEANPHTALIVTEGIRLMRFLRVLRLVSQLLSNAVFTTLLVEARYLRWMRNQTLLSLLYLVYLIAVAVNFLGCLWNFAAGAQNYTNTWVNYYVPFIRRYSATGDQGLTTEEAAEINGVWLYVTGVYWALTTVATVGFGDIVPANALEAVITTLVEAFGVLFFGLIISSISELMGEANRKARRVQVFRGKMMGVESWMREQNLPSRLQRRIKTFYAEVWIRQHEVKEETLLFQELPHALRNEVAWNACSRVFKRLPLLKELDQKTLYLLSSKMTPFRFGPGHDLVNEGDPADRFWILMEGEVIALYQYREAERLEGPAVIGECVLLQDHEESLRTFPCTYRTLTSCILWMIRCRDIKSMLRLRPEVHQHVKARALQSMNDHMREFPELWEQKIKRLGTTSMAFGSIARPASTSNVPAWPADADAAAAARRRLARASAPAASFELKYLQKKSVSWAGQQAAAGGSSSRLDLPAADGQLAGGDSGLQRLPPDLESGMAGHSASTRKLSWSQAAAEAVAAVDVGGGHGSSAPEQRQQQQQQRAGLTPDASPHSQPADGSSLALQSGQVPLQQVVEGLPSAADQSPGGTADSPARLQDVLVVAEQQQAAGADAAAAATAAAAAAGQQRQQEWLDGIEARLLQQQQLEQPASPASSPVPHLSRLNTSEALAALGAAAAARQQEEQQAAAEAAAAAPGQELILALLAELRGVREDLDHMRRQNSAS